MQCRNCGVELEPEALYCQDCGAPVGDQPARTDYSLGQTTYMPAQVKTGKRVSGRNIAIGVTCIALIVAAGLAAAMFLGLAGPASQSAQSASSQAAEESSSASAAAEELAGSDASSEPAASEESSESSSAASEEEGFSQVKAEEQARKDAWAAGMQVFSGTVHVTTFGQRAEEINSKLAKAVSSVSDQELVLFVFGVQENLTATAPDYSGLETRVNQDSLSLGNSWQWEEYDGQFITIAAYPEDMIFPGDVAGMLYSAAGNAEIISPLSEQGYADLTFPRQGIPEYLPSLPTSLPSDSDKKSSSSSEKSSSSSSEKSSDAAAATDGSYILPGSDTRAYSRSELQGLSDYELFVARNEIYARHGRKFQSEDLQKYFNSKSWYKGTVDAGSFSESVLNDTEIANASLIHEIEVSRNSKYL